VHILVAVLLALTEPCTVLPLEPDPFTLGGHRFDAPERIRGLHARGDSSGAPIRVHVAGQADRVFYLWALDTELDGAERYDRLAVSTTPDVADAPEALIPVAARVPDVIPAIRGRVSILISAFDGDLRRLTVCVAPHG
jgi:hypothetical protein